MAKGEVIVAVSVTEAEFAALEGRTFQVHTKPGGRLLLIPVELPSADTRCPAIVGGEQCGERAGHPGKHWWGNGD